MYWSVSVTPKIFKVDVRLIDNLTQAHHWQTAIKDELNDILRHIMKPLSVPHSTSIQDCLKSVIPGLSAESLDRNLQLLAKNDISTIGAVRGCRETFLVNLGLSLPVLGYLLKVK
jgi:hypothetical protein